MEKVVSYDNQFDLFFIHKGFAPDEKFKGNMVVGDLVLDMSTKMRVRGIEILNASQFLNINDKLLNNLADANFDANIGKSSITIGLILKTKDNIQIPTKIAVPIEERIPKFKRN